MAAAVGGTVDLGTGFAQAVMPQVEGKRLTPIAQFGANRAKILPDVPTFGDGGVDFAMPPLTGIWAPSATPDAVVEQLTSAIEKAMQAGPFVEFAKRTLTEVDFANPATFERELQEENRRFAALLKELGMAK